MLVVYDMEDILGQKTVCEFSCLILVQMYQNIYLCTLALVIVQNISRPKCFISVCE